MNLRNPGVILGRVSDLYSVITSELTDEEFSIVGVYYFEASIMNALIYRIFDGTVYPFLTHEINFERLSTHQLVDTMYVYEFNQESWILDGNKDQINSRLKSAINRCLLQSLSPPDYKKIIMNMFGIKENIVINGYYRINEILLTISGDDIFNRKSCLHKSIIECKYLKDPVNISKIDKKEYSDPSIDVVLLDSSRRLTELSNTLISLICDNPSYRRYVFDRKHCKDKDSIKDIEKQGFQLDLDQELFALRNIILQLSKSFTDGTNPVISFSDLLNVYNGLADKTCVEKIEQQENIVYDSITAVVISDGQQASSNELTIPLKSGDKILIPCSGEGLTYLSEDEKIEVLRYILSLRKATNSYNGLIDILIEQCTGKYKRIQTG